MVIQAHQNEMRLDSEQTLRIHSRSSIDIIASDTLTLKAAGSGIEMSGGDVTLITPSQAGYKASKVDWGSGGGGNGSQIYLAQAEIADEPLYTTQFQLLDASNKPREKVRYIAMFDNGDVTEGITNAEGKTQQFQTKQPEEVAVHFDIELLSGVEITRVGEK